MAYLTLYLPAVEAVAIHNRATDLARSAKTAGDPRTLTQLRLDTLTDLLVNAETSTPGVATGIRARIHVTVPALTLLGTPTGDTPDNTKTATTTRSRTATHHHASGTPTPSTPNRSTPTRSDPAPTTGTDASAGAGCSESRYRTEGRTDPTGTDCPKDPAGPADPDRPAAPAGPATCAGSSDDPDRRPHEPSPPGFANLEGYGPIDRLTALRLTRHAPSSTRVLTDPTTGCALTYGREKYRPPADLDELIRLTYTECTFPLPCTTSTTADLDHTIAWNDDGHTELRNISPLCTSHHKVKHHTQWTIEQAPDGTITWTSPAGFEYTVEPTPIAIPTPHFDNEHTPPAPF